MDISLCKVEPRESSPVELTEETRNNSLRNAIGILGVFLAICIHLVFSLWILTIIVVALFFFAALYVQKKVDIGTKIELREKEHELKAKWAKELTAQAIENYIDSFQVVNETLPTFYEEISNKLNVAEKEFNDNAFGPFWDLIEFIVISLYSYNEQLIVLGEKYIEYKNLLEDEEHNFPFHPTQSQLLQNIESLNYQMQSLVRKGQTDFQFATIWEHRKTRKLLVDKFDNLNDAIFNIGYLLQQTLIVIYKRA